MTLEVTPLAVVVTIHNKKAFELISRSESAIGSFWGTIGITFNDEKYEFPLVTIKGYDSATVDHEKSHAWHAIVSKVLTGKNTKDSPQNNDVIVAKWGNAISHADALADKKVLQREIANNPNISQTESFNRIIEYCLNEAKDELLASMNTPGRDMADKLKLMQDEEDTSYNYLRVYLGYKPQDAIYTQLWKEYTTRLEELTKELVDFEPTYKSEFWRKRKAVMANTLVPIPIEEFPSTFNEGGFEAERDLIDKANAELDELFETQNPIRLVKYLHYRVNAFGDASSWDAKITKLRHRRLNRLLIHRSDHSLIVPVTRIRADIAKLKTEILDHPAYEILVKMSTLKNECYAQAKAVESLRKELWLHDSPMLEVEWHFDSQVNVFLEAVEAETDFSVIEHQVTIFEESIRQTYRTYQSIVDYHTQIIQVLREQFSSSILRDMEAVRQYTKAHSLSHNAGFLLFPEIREHNADMEQILTDFQHRNDGKSLIDLQPELTKLALQLRSLVSARKDVELSKEEEITQNKS